MISRLVVWSKLLVLFELASSIVGGVVFVYGFYVLLVERSQVPQCSLEMLNNQNELLVSQLPQITVEVTGAVNHPGVWQFDRTSRVGEALKQAGGFSVQADAEFIAKNLNLASLLKDGDKIYVPFIWEKDLKVENQLGAETKNLISINQASLKELVSLPGIGESRAQAIIENRPYLQLDDLVTKAGISHSIFNELKAAISL
ncbi:MAG: SLBB domain-containing protein [Patescibacteria group bacterium]